MSGTQLYRVSSRRWRSHLSQFQVKDLIPSNFELIHVNSKDKMLDALKMLTTKKIMSAPVWDDEKNDYIGLISMIDLVAAVVFLSDIKSLLDVLADKEVDWQEYIKQENQVLAEGEVGALINVSDREPYSPVYFEFPLLSLMDMFSTDVKLHHVPVNDGDGKVISFISQSRVIDFLSKQIKKFPDLSARKLKDYKQTCSSCPTRKVVSININELAIDAYRKMMDEHVTGLAIVNDNQQLEGVISVTDMKRSLPENIFNDLYLPVSQYLDKCNTSFQKDNDSKRPIACVEDDSMESILDKLTKNRVHRVVVVDNLQSNIPQYVVSLSDIVSMLELY